MLLTVVLISCLSLQSEALFGTPVSCKDILFDLTKIIFCRLPPVAGTPSAEPSEELNVWELPSFSALDRAEATPCEGGVSTDLISSVTSAVSILLVLSAPPS